MIRNNWCYRWKSLISYFRVLKCKAYFVMILSNLLTAKAQLIRILYLRCPFDVVTKSEHLPEISYLQLLVILWCHGSIAVNSLFFFYYFLSLLLHRYKPNSRKEDNLNYIVCVENGALLFLLFKCKFLNLGSTIACVFAPVITFIDLSWQLSLTKI